jgi:hypothetical protein
MPERRFEILFPVAGYPAGDKVDEEHLEGCNVDALVAGGFLRDMSAAAPQAPPESQTPTGG